MVNFFFKTNFNKIESSRLPPHDIQWCVPNSMSCTEEAMMGDVWILYVFHVFPIFPNPLAAFIKCMFSKRKCNEMRSRLLPAKIQLILFQHAIPL